MAKQSIFPYYEQMLNSVRGVDLLEIGGAAMIHFNEVDEDRVHELKYPCRIDALVMVVCLRGEVSFSSHMNNYTLKENQFFISSASIFQFNSIANSEFYMMALNADFLASMNVDARFVVQILSQFRTQTRIQTIQNREMSGVARFFDTVLAESTSKELSSYQELSLKHLFCAIVYRICDAVIGKDQTVNVSSVKDRSSEYLEKLLSLLAENYREHRNVEFYAEMMHISSKHLSRVIRNVTGKSVHQWIDDFVALEIKNLLKYSNMSIQQISFYLNFPNPSFMGQYFKRITGMTPGEYKKS
jgi:AraC-like DNA-binding protein